MPLLTVTCALATAAEARMVMKAEFLMLAFVWRRFVSLLAQYFTPERMFVMGDQRET